MSSGRAYAGAPVEFWPQGNIFDFAFSNPFQKESAYTPSEQRVPPVRGDREIFVDELSERALTYAQLRRDAVSFARGLQSFHLDPRQSHHLPPTPTCPRPEIAPIVLIQLPNCLQLPTVLLGTWAASLTASVVSPALTSTEISWVLQNAPPRMIVTARACEAAMRESLAMQEDPQLLSDVPLFVVDVVDDVYPALGSSPPQSDWKQIFHPDSQTPIQTAPFSAQTRAAVILWSSGTSGRSKGVLLSHRALVFTAASLWHDSDFFPVSDQHQRWLGFAPFYHVFGLTNLLLVAICTGSTVYTMGAFKPDVMLKAIARRRITYLHMAPPVALLLAKSPMVEAYAKKDRQGRNAFSSVVGAIAGGAPLGSDVMSQVYERLGFRVRLGYGLTEAVCVTCQQGMSEKDMNEQRDDSGRPFWGVELMIASADQPPDSRTTNVARAGDSGEILVRSPGLMCAYLPTGGLTSLTPDMSINNAALTPDGWFRTGDVGHLLPTGAVVITDRLKELIKVQGYQVAPAELEAILCSSPSVADSGVIGVYDESTASEWPKAYVVARESDVKLGDLAMELRRLVEKQAARYKWLKGGIVFVDQVPKSPSGKILRRLLRDGGVKGVEVALYGQPRMHKL